MKKIPLLLIYSRLLFAAVIIVLTIIQPAGFKVVVISLMTVGLLSDIFDGIIARKLGISTSKMRRLDTSVDTIFWLSVMSASVITAPAFYQQHLPAIVLLVAAEAMCYGVSYIKFRKEVATHAISSKMWTLILFATLIQLIAAGNAPVLFPVCLYTGLANRLEIICILLLIRQWTNDVPTVYHAVLIRNEKPIRRHKLFNG